MSNYAVLNPSETVIQIVTPPTGFDANALINANVWVALANGSNVVVGDIYLGNGAFESPPGSFGTGGSSPSPYMPVYGNGFIDTSTVVISNTSSWISANGNTFTVPPSCSTIVFDLSYPNSNDLNTINFVNFNSTDIPVGSQRVLITGYGPGGISFYYIMGTNGVNLCAGNGNQTLTTAPQSVNSGQINIQQGYYAEFVFVASANAIIHLYASAFGN